MNNIYTFIKLLGLGLIIFFSGCRNLCTKKPQEFLEAAGIKHGKLANELNYFVLNHGFPKNHCHIRLNIRVGSFDESDSQIGAAHLTEHLAFENRPLDKNQDLSLWLKELGMNFGADANAYTSIDHTLYHFDLAKCDEKTIDEALIILASFLNKNNYQDNIIKKQMQIIDKEEEQQKNIFFTAQDNIRKSLFRGTLFDKKPVLGTKAERDQISPQQLSLFHSQHYIPKKAQIILVGDFQNINISQKIALHFTDFQNPPQALAEPVVGQVQYKEPIIIANVTAMESTETIFMWQPKNLGLKTPSLVDLKKKIIWDLIFSMLKESIDKKGAKLREDELAPPQLYISFNLSKEPQLNLKINTQKENIAAVLKRNFSYIKKNMEYGFSNEQLNKAKAIKTDSLEQSILEESTAQSIYWAEKLTDFVNKRSLLIDAKTKAEIEKNILKKITIKECQENLLELFENSDKYIIAIGNIEDNNENRTDLKTTFDELLTLAAKAPKKDLKAPVEFKYAVKNSSFAIKEKKYFANADIHEFHLANDFRIILKPTSFSKDQILFNLSSDFGTGHSNQEQIILNELLGAALFIGGLKQHTWQEVVELSKDKQLYIAPFSSFNFIGLQGDTRAKDFRFTMELLKAFLTEAAFRENAVKMAKDRIRLAYENNSHQKDSPLKREFLPLLTTADERFFVPTPDASHLLTAQDLNQWLQEILSYPLTLTVVGDFDPELIFKEIGYVFSNLPKATKKTKSPKAFSYLSNIHKEYGLNIEEQDSLIFIRYFFNHPKNIKNNILMWLIKDALHEHLRLGLMEDKQLIYSPQTYLSSSYDNNQPDTLDIVLSTPQNEANKVKTKAISLSHNLSQKGLKAEQLENAKKALINQMDSAHNTSNYFWMSWLMENRSKLASGASPADSLQALESIDLKTINDLLKINLIKLNPSSAIVNSNR